MASINKRRVAAAAIVLLLQRKRKKRRWWIRPAFVRRMEFSEFSNLLPHLEKEDPEMYFKYLRMQPQRFEHLLSILQENLQKFSFREPISAKERLVITLVYLATGCSQQELAFRFSRGRSTISNILSETCDALWNILSPLYLRLPSTREE